VASGGWRTIELDTELFDDKGEFNTTTYTFTANETGRYLIIFLVKLYPIDDQNWGAMRIYKNGASSVAECFCYMSIPVSGSLYMSSLALIELTLGDTLILQTYHNQEGVVNVIAEEGVSALSILKMN